MMKLQVAVLALLLSITMSKHYLIETKDEQKHKGNDYQAEPGPEPEFDYHPFDADEYESGAQERTFKPSSTTPEPEHDYHPFDADEYDSGAQDRTTKPSNDYESI